MTFENDVTPDPSLRSQIRSHLPIAAVLFGVAVAFVALHVAVTGLVIAAAAHVLLGLILLGVRRHRGATSDGTEAR